MDERKIIDAVIKTFLALPIDAASTIVFLTEECGYANCSTEVLMDVYVELNKAAKENGFVLDYLEYSNMFVGLPYTLQFHKRIKKDLPSRCYDSAVLNYSSARKIYPPILHVYLDMEIGAAVVDANDDEDNSIREIIYFCEEDYLTLVNEIQKENYKKYKDKVLPKLEKFAFADGAEWYIELEDRSDENEEVLTLGSSVASMEYIPIKAVKKIINIILCNLEADDTESNF